MPKPRHQSLLRIPPDVAKATNNPTTIRLTWTPSHPAVRSSAGAVVSRTNEILDGWSFRAMRATLGAQIETLEPALICRALGLPVGEPGIGA
jgi:hypothetical protein